jgi:hypothetical protein
MTNQIKLTETQQEALNLINQAIELNANIWSHPKGARGGKDDTDNVCEYCGKHSKDGEGHYFRVLYTGLIVPNRIDEGTIYELSRLNLCDEPQGGGFAIGSTCAKKLLGSKLSFYLGE